MLNPAKKNARKRRAVDRLLCRRVPGLSRTLAFELICIHINGWHWMEERVYICAIQRGGESGRGVDESNRETHVSAQCSEEGPGMKEEEELKATQDRGCDTHT